MKQIYFIIWKLSINSCHWNAWRKKCKHTHTHTKNDV